MFTFALAPENVSILVFTPRQECSNDCSYKNNRCQSDK